MIRYRLTEFLNKHKIIQLIFLCIMFIFLITYIVMFTLDAYNIVNTASYNSELIEDDEDLIVITDYTLKNTTLTLDDKEYDDVKVCFYGITTDNNTTYFNESSKTIISSLPHNFGVSFFISSSAFIVLVSMILIVIALWYVNLSDNIKLYYVNRFTCITASVLLGVFIIIMFAVFLILY